MKWISCVGLLVHNLKQHSTSKHLQYFFFFNCAPTWKKNLIAHQKERIEWTKKVSLAAKRSKVPLGTRGFCTYFIFLCCWPPPTWCLNEKKLNFLLLIRMEGIDWTKKVFLAAKKSTPREKKVLHIFLCCWPPPMWCLNEKSLKFLLLFWRKK